MYFNWDEAKLTFAQKMKLISREDALKSNDFVEGISIVNKIRNKYSHSLEVTINTNDLTILKRIIRKFYGTIGAKYDGEFLENHYSEIGILELFTSFFCSYISGICSEIIYQRTKQ